MPNILGLVALAAILAFGVPAVAQPTATPTQMPPAPSVSIPTNAPQTQITTTAPVSSDTTISVGTIAGQVLQWVAAAFSVPIGALIVAALMKVFTLLGVQVTAGQREQLQAVVVNGLNAAAARNAAALQGRGQIEVKDAIVADAIRYTQDHAADTIKALGLDPQSGSAVEAIKARIETAIADPAVPTPAVITPEATQAKM